METVVDGASIFGAWKPYIVEVMSILISALAGWVLVTVKSKFGIDIEARHREALQSALTNAAGLVIAEAGSLVSALRIDVRSAALAEGIRYVATSAPDALKYFGMSPEKLREMLAAKVGVVAATNTPLDPTPNV